jgi:cytochrome c oxidase subunit II
MRARLTIACLLLAAIVLVGGCERAPLNYMSASGAYARPVVALNWGLTIVSCAVIVIISALVLWGIFKRRAPAAASSEIVRTGGGMAFIYTGTAITLVVLLVFLVWTLATLARVSHAQSPPKVTVEIVGHQWWWEMRYRGDVPARTFTTANELHIPVGQPVEIRVTTADVIHSFWVPQLAGKIDTIPGQHNVRWLEADQPGVYYGQCTEYCGHQHAHMALTVVAEPSEAFGRWWDHQLSDAAVPSAGDAADGYQVFLRNCAACHTVRGTGAGGILGPDLSHIAQRLRLPAGVYSNTPATLAQWVSQPQAIKPGALMPNPQLDARQLHDVVAFLETLR